MKFSDMITLAKAGYKIADIKELLSLATDEPTEPKDVTEPKPTEPTPEPTKPTEPGDGEPSEPTEPAEPEPDYKKLYEDTQKALKEAQAANRKGDTDTHAMTPEEIAIAHFNNILR